MILCFNKSSVLTRDYFTAEIASPSGKTGESKISAGLHVAVGKFLLNANLLDYIHYRQKIWNIFYYSNFFAFLWSVHGVSVLEIHFCEQISLWGELIST